MHLKDEKHNLNKEYELQMRKNEDMEKKVFDKDQHIARLKADITKYQQSIKEKETYINKFMQDINSAVTQHEPRLWAEDLKELYKRYVRQEVIEKL